MSREIENDDLALRLREEITRVDLELLEAVNRRIELVQRLRERKLERGYPMVDGAREDWLVDRLVAANGGPISEDGVRRLAEQIIALVKAEVYEQTGAPPSSS